jgi:diaminopimelate epimerase
MHGALNDFVVLDNRRERVADIVAFGTFACDRHRGLGADGLLSIETSELADAKMRVINADGGEAEMCGNGMRCVARYLCEAGEGDRLRVETLGGIIETSVVSREPFTVRVNVGTPHIEDRALPFARARSVLMGNPHVVIFTDDLDSVDLESAARDLRTAFPDGINVHAAVRENEHGFTVRHWERGVGATMACGTGVVSVAVAAIAAGDAVSPVQVRVPGGELVVEWDGRGSAYLTGPAVRVLDGAFDDVPFL